MSRLAIVLSVLLFASGTLSGDLKKCDINDVIDNINEHTERVELKRNRIFSNLEQYLSDWLDYGLDSQHSLDIYSGTTAGSPDVGFARSNPELDGISCRDFLRTNGEYFVDECKQLYWHFMTITSEIVKTKTDAILTYLNVTKMAVSGNENTSSSSYSNRDSCIAKIEEIASIVRGAELSILKTFRLAKNKYENYIVDMSYCVLVKHDFDEALSKAWYAACSPYINPLCDHEE